MSARKKIARNTLVQLVGKAITASSTLLVTMLITRHFGPAGFGDFMIMITFPTLFWIMADFGFNATVIREISKKEENTQRYFANLLLIRLGLAGLFTVVALVVLRFLPYSPLVKLGAGLNLSTLFLMAVFSSTQTIFQANSQQKFQVAAQVLGALLNLGLVAGLIHFSGDLLWVALGSLLGNLLMVVMGIFWARRFIDWRQIKWERVLASKLLRLTLPIGLALIFDILDFKIDSFMLSVLPLPGGRVNSAVVGYYGTAFKILEVTLTVPFFFMSAVYPLLVRRFQESWPAAEKLFRQSFLSLLVVSVLGVVFGEALAPWLIRFLAGAEFGQAVPALRLLLLALPVFFITSLLMHTLLALERQRVLPFVYGGALVVNLGLNFFFIPRYSLLAAAAITGVTELLVLSLLAWFVFREFSRKVRQDASV